MPPQLGDQAHEPLGPDPQLQRILHHVDPPDQDLGDAR
jgi:hypothetical protein